ncbi:MAG TPA: hypothetical protein EYO32_00940 [Rhodospirillales bacterium]|nr:hypothetical protein [Rhodospirillales bacterium]
MSFPRSAGQGGSGCAHQCGQIFEILHRQTFKINFWQSALHPSVEDNNSTTKPIRTGSSRFIP